MAFVYENENREIGLQHFYLIPSTDRKSRNVTKDMIQGNPIYGEYDNFLDLQSNNQSSNQFKDQINSRAFNGTVYDTQSSQFVRHHQIPLPNSRPEGGRPGDVAKYYSALDLKFIGKII